MKSFANSAWAAWKRGLCAAMSVLLAAQMVPLSALAADVGADASQQTTAQGGNAVTQYVSQEDGKTKTIYWTQGVTPPQMGGENSDFVRTESTAGGETYVEYIAPFTAGNGWYDINKSESLENDANLCFAAAASNTLHWWLAQNREYIDLYLPKLQQTDSGKAAKLQSLRVDAQEQTGSPIYKIFVDQFAKRQEGYWTDILQDQFLNGYKPKANGGVNDEDWDGPALIANGPDKNGGFFYDVLKAKRLTRRSYYDAGYDTISKELKDHLINGEIVLLSYAMGQAKSHVVTVWGVEYDQNGKLSAVYISDSDDAKQQGMVRYGIYRTGRGQAILSNRTNGGGTTLIESLQILSQGTQQWKQYLGIEQRALHLRWDNTELTYNGKTQCPTVSTADIQAGDDVRLDVTGGAADAGTHTAQVHLIGKDAGKYEISGSDTIQYTIQPASATVQLTAEVQNGRVNLTAEVSGLNGEVPAGKVRFAKDGEAVTEAPLQGNKALGTCSISEAGEYTFDATYIPAEGGNYKQSVSALQKVDVAKQIQAALTIEDVGRKVYGEEAFALRVSGGSTNGAVTYTSSDPTVLRIDGSEAVICGAGTATLTATMEGDAVYSSVTATLAVTVDKAPAPSIAYPAASAITYGQKLSASALNGGSTEYGSFAWSNPDAVLNAGAASAEIRFTPNEQTIRNYETITDCSHTASVAVQQAAPNVTVRAENLETTENRHT
ncbi:MAG: IdeS/Mac family cysteine endopeptidase, partial [Agathobaculum sp.]|uniref:IdeS/Mac family cysteine endopeptidase n=1 Tax=Agathobaculum sp. TaxID=2048138 RepID=UPI003D8C245F